MPHPALNPAPGPWLYYVLEEPGVHYFTDDYANWEAEHGR